MRKEVPSWCDNFWPKNQLLSDPWCGPKRLVAREVPSACGPNRAVNFPISVAADAIYFISPTRCVADCIVSSYIPGVYLLGCLFQRYRTFQTIN